MDAVVFDGRAVVCEAWCLLDRRVASLSLGENFPTVGAATKGKNNVTPPVATERPGPHAGKAPIGWEIHPSACQSLYSSALLDQGVCTPLPLLSLKFISNYQYLIFPLYID